MKFKKILVMGILSFLLAPKAGAQTFSEACYTPGLTRFQLFAPDNAKQVTLRIYDDGQGGKPVKTVKMKRTAAETYSAELKGDLKGKFYTFDTGAGECAGVFAKAVGVNGQRAAIIDMSATDPEGWDTDRITTVVSPADLIVYEMHHRDFSVDPSSGLVNKGKFLALTEPNAIEHLKKLGVNAVHILPSFDYASVDETRLNEPQYNWGYDPVNYNVPEGSYSTDPYTPATRIKEFKQMVQALHKAGIRVILDVVYNHTFNIEGSNFERIYPGYFYRKTADGRWSDGSGCGNEESIKFGIAGAISHPQVDMTKVNYSKEAWAAEPVQMLSYVSCHDDMCLVDRLRTSIPGIGMDELIRLDLLAQTAVMTSQGMPFILSGEEMLRDKKGVHNSFNSPDSINRIDWTNLEKYPQVMDYYSKLISLRKNHPAFRLGTADKVRRHLEFLPVQDNLVAFRLKDNAGGDAWKNIIVVLNSAKEARTVAVPEGSYTVVCRDGVINESGLGIVSGSEVNVPAQSALIIHD